MENTATTGQITPQNRTARPRLALAFNDWQRVVIDEAPASYRGIFESAYGGNSKASGIKAFCLRCVGYLRNEVRDCTSYGCPLHPYRPYQDGNGE